MGRIIFCAAVAVALGATGCSARTLTKTVTRTTTVAVAAGATRAVFVPQANGPPEYKPSSIYVSDTLRNTTTYNVEKWLSYGGEIARARAEWDRTDCSRSCAEGHSDVVYVTVSLSGVYACDGVPAYGSLGVETTSNEKLVPEQSDVVLANFCRR